MTKPSYREPERAARSGKDGISYSLDSLLRGWLPYGGGDAEHADTQESRSSSDKFVLHGKPDEHGGILYVQFRDQVFAVAIDRELAQE